VDVSAAWQPLRNWWLPAWLADPLRRCRHEHQRRIYGDEIIAANWHRVRCLDCGRLLEGMKR
jgi:hypothetical protein